MKPFVKWAGGKTKLIPEILKRLPKKWNNEVYLEPFVGGGSVFFFLAQAIPGGLQRAHLSDVNDELMNAFRMVRDQPEQLISRLRQNKFSKKAYYEMRDARPKTAVARAERFLYLNRTCFNGLWRVNRAGHFNVPMGDYKNPLICDDGNIRSCAAILKVAITATQTFHETIDGAMRGDFIYCDPPYLPKTETAEFTSYTKEGFTLSDHEQLHAELTKAHKRGALWMLSEGDSPFIRKLFKGYNVMPVNSRHTVAASSDSRGKSKELLITNYEAFSPWHDAR